MGSQGNRGGIAGGIEPALDDHRRGDRVEAGRIAPALVPGGPLLGETRARLVAAYVWSLSNGNAQGAATAR